MTMDDDSLSKMFRLNADLSKADPSDKSFDQARQALKEMTAMCVAELIGQKVQVLSWQFALEYIAKVFRTMDMSEQDLRASAMRAQIWKLIVDAVQFSNAKRTEQAADGRIET